MYKATALFFSFALLIAGTVYGQNTEYVFNPERTGELTDPFPVGSHNGARGLSGPWDLDRDGNIEVLIAQHDAAGGRVHVIENTGLNTWEYVYSTAFIDSSSSSQNTRYAIGTDLDGDGNWEITFVAGTSYNTDANPLYIKGAYVFEHDGVVGSDNYGTLPATIGNFYELDGLDPSTLTFVRAQNMQALDVDNDGDQELLIPANGNSSHDVFYVLSVSGDFQTDGFGTTFETWFIETRQGPRERDLGGGSPTAFLAGDLNGDGNMDLSFHSWNNYNFFNGTVTGPNAYTLAPDGNFIKAAPSDYLARFGGVVVDIDNDGNDEIFYTNDNTKDVSVLNYDAGEDVLQIDASHLVYDAIPIRGSGGIAVGDIDNDGQKELIVGASGYTATRYNNGQPSEFIAIAEFNGGDPTDGANYAIQRIDTSSPIDTTAFNIIHRDSLGTQSTFFETAFAKQGVTDENPDLNGDPVFPSGIAYLGDADGDGAVEIALTFQGVDDSLLVINEVWNTDSLRYDRTVMERFEAPVRAFFRIISLDGFAVSIEDERIVVPSEYVLSPNYPNPFNPSTSFTFTLPIDKRVSVRIYNMMGRLVRTLVNNEYYVAGTHQATWDGTSDAGVQVASGTYIYTLDHGNYRQSRTMLLIK